MDCPVRAISGKKSLTKVPGVTATKDDFDKREAVLTFGDAKASLQQLTQASANAGHPSGAKRRSPY